MRATALVLILAVLFAVQGAASQQLQQPRSCTAAVQSDYLTSRSRVTDLSEFRASSKFDNGSLYRDVAAQYDLTRGCCPEGSYITEWEVVLKTFYAPEPFDDGQYRSLNGTLLPAEVVQRLRLRGSALNITYQAWDQYSDKSWDDVQGIALTTLHNKTILGSIQAKCGLKNGTIVAELPRVGANLTSDCLQAPGLAVVESQPIRVFNSSSASRFFFEFLVDNTFKLPKNLQSEAMRSLPLTLKSARAEDSPYQDFMGLMHLLGLSAEDAPAEVDLAALDWRRFRTTWLLNGRYAEIASQSAATGFVGLAGCFGPTELVVFDDRLYIDNPPTPAVSSYGGCARNSSSMNYRVIGTAVNESRSGEVSRFRNEPLVCCPEGEHVSKVDMQFRAARGFSNPVADGNFTKRLWSVRGICSGGTKLQEISVGDGCTGSGALLPPENLTLNIRYDNDTNFHTTQIVYKRDAGGILGLFGTGPGGPFESGPIVDLGGLKYEEKDNQHERIVGMDATATCSGIASIGLVLRPRSQIHGGGTPAYKIALGVVGGVLAAFVMGVAVWRRRQIRGCFQSLRKR